MVVLSSDGSPCFHVNCQVYLQSSLWFWMVSSFFIINNVTTCICILLGGLSHDDLLLAKV